ncbi:MAG TPA: altronate dehydratase family protein [Patescibacteria group bacterium]|nr:altronate dehydratase family protein [Patescibacteria group bacterium]
MSVLRIHELDNVAVAIDAVTAGESVTAGGIVITSRSAVEKGHKLALRDIAPGEPVVKYGFPIGRATMPIQAGDWVHVHNLKTGLGDILEYQFQPFQLPEVCGETVAEFQGYRRADGRVGVRNEIWIIPTVSCVNRAAQLIARAAAVRWDSRKNIDGIFELTHPYGCSQLGEDHCNTQQILANFVAHPNAGGVLVLGLGCENNHIAEFKKVLGNYDERRVKFLVAQEVEDEVASGLELVEELIEHAEGFSRSLWPVSELVVGLKCGGSDGFSGITANPLVGALSDRLICQGGSSVLTEVPEMFGAETLLMNRAVNSEVFTKTVKLINDFKTYFSAYNQPIYENPSPGNKKGGISTLEEKSLGCTQKGGSRAVVDVLPYGGTVSEKGLNLLSAPGNDMVAATALAAAGCQIILFTTGRGTPLGTVIPTVKIATNSDVFRRKANWMDFDAGPLLAGKTLDEVTDEFFAYLLSVASGKMVKAESMGFREITIFKNGVTL